MALDDGEVRAGGRRATIRELELELKDGDPAALWALADEFATSVPLRPATASKAARGAAPGRRPVAAAPRRRRSGGAL